MMDTLIIPTLHDLRHWLDKMGVTFFECNACQALHLPHMQNFEGIFDAKLDLADNVVLFTVLAEVKPSALLMLAADLSAINASSLTMKAFLDVEDDNLPKLVVCQALPAHVGITYEQFASFIRHSEEQVSMVVLEAGAQQLLYSEDQDSHNNQLRPQYLH